MNPDVENPSGAPATMAAITALTIEVVTLRGQLQRQATEMMHMQTQLANINDALSTMTSLLREISKPQVHAQIPEEDIQYLTTVSPVSTPMVALEGNSSNDQTSSGLIGQQNQDTRLRFKRGKRPLPRFNVMNSQLFKDLQNQKLMGPMPAKSLTPPFPKWYRPDLQCEYHMGTIGHSIDNCDAFRCHVWALLDREIISIDGSNPSVQSDPLPRQNMLSNLTFADVPVFVRTATLEKKSPNARMSKNLVGQQSRDARSLSQHDDKHITNTQIFHDLQDRKIMGPKPIKPLTPPFPKWYRPNLQCEYHMGVVGHSIDNCDGFRHHIQKLIDNNVISAKGMSITIPSDRVLEQGE